MDSWMGEHGGLMDWFKVWTRNWDPRGARAQGERRAKTTEKRHTRLRDAEEAEG